MEGSFRKINNFLWVSNPNLEANGSVAWWLDVSPEPVLIDCPALTPTLIQELKALACGRSARIILTNRDSHGCVCKLQTELDWPVLIQEQEAYLLPGLKRLKTFSNDLVTPSGMSLMWTPGPSPGSCVVHAPSPSNVLFCGRLLIPVADDYLSAFRSRSTFHWSMQQISLRKICEWPPLKALPLLASGVWSSRVNTPKLFAFNQWKN